jgi:hypothetical protein
LPLPVIVFEELKVVESCVKWNGKTLDELGMNREAKPEPARQAAIL